jgi:hypothetical protein
MKIAATWRALTADSCRSRHPARLAHWGSDGWRGSPGSTTSSGLGRLPGNGSNRVPHEPRAVRARRRDCRLARSANPEGGAPNHDDRVVHRARRGRPPRTAAIIVVTVGLTVLAACGGGSSGSQVAQLGSTPPQASASSTGPGGSASTGAAQDSQMLAFADCMRAHGVHDWPDQAVNGKFPIAEQLGVSDSQYRAAMDACQHLLPNGGNAPNQSELQEQLSALRRFSHCIRAQGVTEWPDPTIGSGGTPSFNLLNIHPPIDTNSPQFASKLHACGHLVPHSVGGIRLIAP